HRPGRIRPRAAGVAARDWLAGIRRPSLADAGRGGDRRGGGSNPGWVRVGARSARLLALPALPAARDCPHPSIFGVLDKGMDFAARLLAWARLRPRRGLGNQAGVSTSRARFRLTVT